VAVPFVVRPFSSPLPGDAAAATVPSQPAYPVTVLENFWANAAYSVTPTILVGLIFWLVIRSIFRADRTERQVYSRIEAEEREKRGLGPKAPGATPAS
jgi:hypothetical protein